MGYAPIAMAQSSDEFAQMDEEIAAFLREAGIDPNDPNTYVQKTTTQTTYRVTDDGKEVHTQTTYTITTTSSNFPSDSVDARQIYRIPDTDFDTLPADAEPSYPAGSRSQISYRVPDSRPSVAPNATRPAESAPSISVSLPEDNSVSYYALLSDYEKKLYASVYQAALEVRPKVTVSGDLDSSAISRVIRAVVNDHPEMVWMKEGYSKGMTLIGNEVTKTDITIIYNDLAQDPEKALKDMKDAALPILEKAKKYKTPKEQEKYLHDYLVQNIKYTSDDNDQNAYGALVSKKAVCAGIARAYKYLLDQLSIQNYVVTGQMIDKTGAEPHAWNLVVFDGKCYNVDVTSDEVEVVRGKKRYTKTDDRLFNKPDSVFEKLGYLRESDYSDEATKLPQCK